MEAASIEAVRHRVFLLAATLRGDDALDPAPASPFLLGQRPVEVPSDQTDFALVAFRKFGRAVHPLPASTLEPRCHSRQDQAAQAPERGQVHQGSGGWARDEWVNQPALIHSKLPMRKRWQAANRLACRRPHRPLSHCGAELRIFFHDSEHHDVPEFPAPDARDHGRSGTPE